jgi:ADP-ribose pyrophosphatase YjhB (NUDIX family)
MWLEERGIDTRSWRPPGAKQVGELWREIAEGEATIQDTPPLRLVNVVQLIIRRGDFILVEAEQELGNGGKRWRNRPPSEKMKAGESVTDAALRCLREELGVDMERVTLLGDTLTQSEQVAESPSYPGLPTQYTFHSLEAEVDGLPDVDFWRVNSAFFKGGDPVRRHRWAWRPFVDP